MVENMEDVQKEIPADGSVVSIGTLAEVIALGHKADEGGQWTVEVYDLTALMIALLHENDLNV